MHQTNLTERKLKEFKSRGIEIAIDDFGTGYSSLACLNRFNIEYIKIDKMFVNRICESVSDFYLCEAIIAMAHKLKLKVVAEGIETAEQRKCLTEMGCDYGQGYLFSKPIDAREIDSFMELYAERRAQRTRLRPARPAVATSRSGRSRILPAAALRGRDRNLRSSKA